MSVLANNTNITFQNDTNYFLEIKFSGEQNSNLRVFHETSNIITKNQTNFIDYLYSLVAGKESKIVHVNIPLRNTTSLTVKCNANLYFQVHTKIQDSKDNEYGSFQIATEFQNNDLVIKFTESHGVGYDRSGNVCINTMEPEYRDLVIKSRVLLANKPLDIEYEDAFCKMKV